MFIDPPGANSQRSWLQRIHLDGPLLVGILSVATLGGFVLYSAGGENLDLLVRQAIRLSIAFGVMLVFAQLSPRQLQRWAPWVYLLGLGLLFAVLIFGHVGKGAQRWLDLGVMRFQPSEMLKLALPLMVAWYFADKSLPPNWKQTLLAILLITIPVLLIAKQPDLGTSILIASSGIAVIFLAGLHWRLIFFAGAAGGALLPALWYLMRDYQRQRVLTFLDPESDPLGAGYHIIQSKIAIGSGGIFGKGWMNGTQSQLDFLPERSTDFIFAVLGEELGLIGLLLLLFIYLLVIMRGLYIAINAQDTCCRLLAGSLSLTFFVYVFVNTGMVTGLLPVVGLPLPLISYGGSSMVTLMAGFGILMSIHTHRKLLPA